MHIINYKYGWMFECVIHGKIVMTRAEWKKALTFLFRGARRWIPSYRWTVDALRVDILLGIPIREGVLYQIRVPATEALVKKHPEELRKYKRGNYMIQVIDHKLKIKSLHDAQAECLCGWHCMYTGARSSRQLRTDYGVHLKRHKANK